MPQLTEIGRFALRYNEEFGWPVIPLWPGKGDRCFCHEPNCEIPGKHPAVKWGGHIPLPELFDSQWIKEKWTEYAWGIGIPTGPTTNLLSIDFDKAHGGLDTAASLAKQHGDYPRTPTFDTGGGGFQQIYQYPGGYIKTRAGVRPGMDVRGSGGLFVAPPTTHRLGKQYRWRSDLTPTKVSVAPLPEWLHRIITEEVVATGAGGSFTDKSFIPPGGERNDFISSWLGSLRNVYPRDLVEPIVVLLARQLEQSDEWAYDSINRMYQKPAIRPGRTQYERELIAANAPEEGMPLLSIKEAWNPNRPKPKYLIKGFLAERDICAIVSPPEMGKSLLSLHLAIAVATGKPVFGQLEVPQRQRVLYINAENPDEMFYDRIRDVANGMGVNADDLEGWLFVTKEGNFDLGSGTPDSVLVEELLFKYEIKLVILDSLVSFLRGNPDNAKEVREWFDTVARDWRRRFNCASVLLHHENKGDPKYEKSLRRKTDKEAMRAARNSGDIPAGVERFISLEKEIEKEDAFGPTLEIYLKMAKARRGDKRTPLLLQVERPDEDTTTFVIKTEYMQGSALEAEGFAKEILARQQPLPQMTLKALIESLMVAMHTDEKKTRKWIQRLEKKGVIEGYAIGGEHNEKGIKLKSEKA